MSANSEVNFTRRRHSHSGLAGPCRSAKRVDASNNKVLSEVSLASRFSNTSHFENKAFDGVLADYVKTLKTATPSKKNWFQQLIYSVARRLNKSPEEKHILLRLVNRRRNVNKHRFNMLFYRDLLLRIEAFNQTKEREDPERIICFLFGMFHKSYPQLSFRDLKHRVYSHILAMSKVKQKAKRFFDIVDNKDGADTEKLRKKVDSYAEDCKDEAYVEMIDWSNQRSGRLEIDIRELLGWAGGGILAIPMFFWGPAFLIGQGLGKLLGTEPAFFIASLLKAPHTFFRNQQISRYFSR